MDYKEVNLTQIKDLDDDNSFNLDDYEYEEFEEDV